VTRDRQTTSAFMCLLLITGWCTPRHATQERIMPRTQKSYLAVSRIAPTP